MRLLLVCAVSLVGVLPAAAKDCRVPRGALAAGGKHEASGCAHPARAKDAPSEAAKRLEGDRGFIDLGNGTQVRIGGRVRMEGAVQR